MHTYTYQRSQGKHKYSVELNQPREGLEYRCSRHESLSFIRAEQVPPASGEREKQESSLILARAAALPMVPSAPGRCWLRAMILALEFALALVLCWLYCFSWKGTDASLFPDDGDVAAATRACTIHDRSCDWSGLSPSFVTLASGNCSHGQSTCR
eukprot:CAMPEP_0198127300 /NCGR_PEP_ID=MMETSP1442-20131203/46858_1 /TAXON_ID= /ORGANISM="Craspedostauros australis, Strain CCMP3328" /LENGTH=154 /DNA_ID=CAMNT_0043787249 /DNA_START=134 /DNA_END=594 /DNA_ORIENTATION=-